MDEKGDRETTVTETHTHTQHTYACGEKSIALVLEDVSSFLSQITSLVIPSLAQFEIN